MRIIILLIILLSLCCAEKPEQRKTLDEKTFVQVYCDVVSKVDFFRQEQREAFVDSVLTNYHTSRETFENTIQKYSKNPKKWQNIFKKINAELERRLEQLENESKPGTPKTPKNR